MLELNRDAQTSLWSHDWHFFFIFFIVIGYCLFITSQSPEVRRVVWGLWPLLFLCVILMAHQRAAERRAQRRLQLLLTVIRSLERREDATARP